MESYTSPEDYGATLTARAALPEGFRAGTATLSFVAAERASRGAYAMNLSLLVLDEPTPSFAGVFTRNAFPGYPVIVGRKRLTMPFSRGVIVNNKVANVCAPDGEKDVERLLARLAEAAGGDADDYFSCSTGIIGWKLPVREMEESIPALVSSARSDSLLGVASAIMTTDRYPKVRSAALGEGRIVAVAKGAGMIEPNMATMLAFVATDLEIKRQELQETLSKVAGRTFNRISIDGDQSTSDTVLAFSSRKRRAVSPRQFEEGLATVCAALAEDLVRNGEGTSHVIRVAVGGAPSDAIAVDLGKAILNSPLVKTAVFGNDPNVGRIVSAIGDYLGNRGEAFNPAKVRVRLGDEVIFSEGRFHLDASTEERLARLLKEAQLNPKIKGYPEHDRTVDIVVDLGAGSGQGRVIGSDLSDDYVRENADYRT